MSFELMTDVSEWLIEAMYIKIRMLSSLWCTMLVTLSMMDTSIMWLWKIKLWEVVLLLRNSNLIFLDTRWFFMHVTLQSITYLKKKKIKWILLLQEWYIGIKDKKRLGEHCCSHLWRLSIKLISKKEEVKEEFPNNGLIASMKDVQIS